MVLCTNHLRNEDNVDGALCSTTHGAWTSAAAVFPPRTIRRERTPISGAGTANREVHIPEISVCAGDSLATGQMGIQGSFRFI